MSYSRHREMADGWIDPAVQMQYSVYGTAWRNAAVLPPTRYADRQAVCDDELHGKPPYIGRRDRGGPLDLWKFELGSPFGAEFSVRSNDLSPNLCPYRYKGRWFILPITTSPTGAPAVFPYWKDSSWGDASDYGATGWSKYKPAKPGVDLGVSLAEMRETFTSLMRRARTLKDLYDGRRNLPTNPFGNALEANFGWLPLVSDIQKAIQTYSSLDDMIDRIRKMNGQWEHRGGPVNKQNESWTTTSVPCAIRTTFVTPFYEGLSFPAYQANTLEHSYQSYTWFEGSFKYYIPDINTEAWAAKARRKLMGLDINPSLAWELIPWSWLVDWLSNAGDVFSNMDNGLAENLVAAYAYVMRTTTYTINLVATHNYLECISPRKVNVQTMSLLHKWQRKHRVAASPFGFGIDFGSFSPKQVAIMAMLGLSRT